MFTQGI